MSEELFKAGYGAMLRCDADVLDACIDEVCQLQKQAWGNPDRSPTVGFLEVGMHDGGTAMGVASAVNSRGCWLRYVGIDPDPGDTRPRSVPAGGRVIVGDSALSFPQVREAFDVVLIDGCHCLNHVVLDTIHYAPLVHVGGFLLYHDVNPRIQMRADAGHQYCGANGVPEFGIAVNAGIAAFMDSFGRLNVRGALFEEHMNRVPEDLDREDCGMRSYRRIG